MKKRISLLAGIFGLQIVIALLILFLGDGRSGDFTSESLINFDQEQIDKIMISDSDSDVTLVRHGDQWQIANNGLPIEQKKLESLIEKLVSLKTAWPATTTSSSHKRFEVSNEKHRRKISLLKEDETIVELYVGTSPGFKKSHLRIGDQSEVYALEFNAYDAPVARKDWLDKSLLTVKSVTRIKGGDYTLEKEGDSWRIEPAQVERELNQEQANNLAQALSTLTVMDFADEVPEFSKEQTTVLEVSNGDDYVFELSKNADKYYVKRKDIDHIFMLSQYEYERLEKPREESLTSVVSVDSVKDQSSNSEKTKDEMNR